MSFKDVLGADNIFKRFKDKDHLSNVYIITGEKGSGKGLAAKEAAKYLNCMGQDKPCDICDCCVSIEAGSYPDVYTVTGNKSIGVDEIRDVIERAAVKPYASRYNIFIIDKADDMTPEAQNAILKTLEECKKSSIFLLLTDSITAVLPTIRSRAQILSMKRAGEEELVSLLMRRYDTSREQALFAARFSKGVVGRAVKLIQPEYLEFRRRMYDAIDSLKDMKPYDAFDIYKSLKPDRATAGDMLNILESFYRDMLMIKYDKNALIINVDKQSYIENYGSFSDEELIRIISRIEETGRYISHNTNIQLTFDVLFLDIMGV